MFWVSYFLALYSVIAVALGVVIDSSWEITEYDRAVDFQKSYLMERHDIHAINVGSEPADEYILALPQPLAESKSMIIPLLKEPTVDRQFIPSEELTDVENGAEGIVYYRLRLPVPISPKSTIHLSVSYMGLDQFKPVPEYAPMSASQSLTHVGSKYPASPYVIDRYAIALVGVGPDANYTFESVESDPTFFKLDRKKDTLVTSQAIIGPIPANTVIPMSVQFTKNTPLIYVENLNRDLWVSHWSDTLEVEQYFELTNAGVKLDKGFSRADWMNSKLEKKPSPAITTFQLGVPEDPITGVYYRDKVGNVSTSIIIDDRIVLKPRFPLFGGWHYNFTVGWTSELHNFLKQGTNDEYVLKFNLLDNAGDASFKHVNLTLYLPEGALFQNVSVPFNYEGLTLDHAYSYLDRAGGHTKLTLEFKNLVDGMKDAIILVQYKYPSQTLWIKPIMTSLYVFLALLALYVLRKLNLSIKPAETTPTKKAN